MLQRLIINQLLVTALLNWKDKLSAAQKFTIFLSPRQYEILNLKIGTVSPGRKVFLAVAQVNTIGQRKSSLPVYCFKGTGKKKYRKKDCILRRKKNLKKSSLFMWTAKQTLKCSCMSSLFPPFFFFNPLVLQDYCHLCLISTFHLNRFLEFQLTHLIKHTVFQRCGNTQSTNCVILFFAK